MTDQPTAGTSIWRHWPRAVLPLLLLFLGAWGVWAILRDRQPCFSDSVLGDSDLLYRALRHGSPPLMEYMRIAAYRPLLTYLPASLIYLLTGPSLTVLRLTVLLQYLAAVYVAFDIGRVLVGRRAGLLAAVMLGTFPSVFGWGRMAYVDTGLGLMVLVGLRVLLRFDPARPASGARLGLVVGLGMLTKVAYPVFAIGPLLWTLLRVRRLRHLAGLALAAAVAAAVAGWWYAVNWSMVVANISMSTGTQQVENVGQPLAHRLLTALPAALTKLVSYTVEVDGAVWLLSLALVGAVAAWRLRTVPGDSLLLLSLTLWLSLAVVLVFDQARRYVLPIYMVAATLAGLTTQSALERVGGRRLGRVALAVLSALLLGLFVAFNLGLPVYTPRGGAHLVAGPRVDGVGMLSPDPRPLQTYPALIKAVRGRFSTCMMVFAAPELQERQLFRQLLRTIHDGERSPFVEHLQRYREDHAAGSAVCAVEVTGDHQRVGWEHAPQFEAGMYSLCLAHAWFAQVGRLGRRLGRWGPSPIGLRYALYELPPRALSLESTHPHCRLRRVGWDRSGLPPGSR